MVAALFRFVIGIRARIDQSGLPCAAATIDSVSACPWPPESAPISPQSITIVLSVPDQPSH